MKQKILLIAFLLTGLTPLSAQRTIQGKIVDADDNWALIGVSVTALNEKGIKYGVLTNVDGEFSLTVANNVKTFICSYIGYRTQEVEITDKNEYIIRMSSETKTLNEVVVTGYQEIERRKLTSAISKIDVSDEKMGMVHSIDQALSGQIAGLSSISTSGAPGAPMKIRIRGTASLNGTQDPLWVLDGIPLEGTDVPKTEALKDIDDMYSTSIAGLNPSDIESITVLKDAAATAIYGARAANGVIVITTKKGKVGKPIINFSTKLALSPKTNIARLNLMNAEEKVGLELDLLRSEFTYRANKGEVARILARENLTQTYIDNGWSALPAETQRAVEQLKALNYDWNDILFRNAFTHEYNLSVSGANDKANYYTSIGYYNELGNVTGVAADRFNVVGKTTYALSDKVNFGVSVFGNRRTNSSYLTDYDGFTNPVFYSRRVNPYQAVYDSDGKYIYDIDIQGRGDSNLNFNILEERANTTNRSVVQSVSTIFDAVARFSDYFNITSQLGIQSDLSSLEKTAAAASYAMRKDHLRAERIGSDGILRSFLPQGGMHKQTETKLSQVTWKMMGNYKYSHENTHEIDLMAGTEVRKTWYQSLFSAGYGYDAQMLTFEPLIYPKVEDARYFPQHSKSYVENAYVSAFGTASYSYKYKYILGGSIRFDGSDIYGVDSKYRYLPLYSVSGLWRISNEPFMRRLRAVDNLSVRASYGLQGNIDKNTSPFVMGVYNTTQILPGTQERIIVITSPPNKKLRWEKTTSVNAGIDLSLFKQAINLNIDFYYRRSSDLIGMQMLPLETGFDATTINWASMSNQGVEFSLTTRNIQTRDFSWFTNLNVGFNTNQVIQESVPANQVLPSRVGYPIGAIFALKSAGLDKEGYPLYYDKAGNVKNLTELFHLKPVGVSASTDLTPAEERDNYHYIGSSEPPFAGGINNTFTYKGFQLGVNCIFNLGYYTRIQPSYSIVGYDRGLNANRDILERWTEKNHQGRFPALITNGKRKAEYAWYLERSMDAMSDRWVKKTNYLRVQSIRLGYSLPDTFAKQLKMISGNIAVEARNLLVLASDYTNSLDPETMGNPFAQPIPKTVVLSLNVKF